MHARVRSRARWPQAFEWLMFGSCAVVMLAAAVFTAHARPARPWPAQGDADAGPLVPRAAKPG